MGALELRAGIGHMTARKTLDSERRALLSPINSAAIYDMQAAGEKERLGHDLWRRDFGADLQALRAANPEFVAVLRAKIVNTSAVTEKSVLSDERHIDGMLLDVTRAQNMFKIPLMALAGPVHQDSLAGPLMGLYGAEPPSS